jgi:hypothetical protein
MWIGFVSVKIFSICCVIPDGIGELFGHGAFTSTVISATRSEVVIEFDSYQAHDSSSAPFPPGGANLLAQSGLWERA